MHHDRLVGRIEVQTDDVDQLLLEPGSLDSLNFFTKWGFRPRADQTRWVVSSTPQPAIVRILQCVCPSWTEF